jgi:hypothetical protein
MKIKFPAIKRWFGITQQHDENACEERFDILLFRTQFSVITSPHDLPSRFLLDFFVTAYALPRGAWERDKLKIL